jgi:hypothetical protein
MGMITKLAGLGVGLVGVFWLAIVGGWAVWKYDRMPCGWPNYQVHILFFHPTLKLRDSQGCRLDRQSAAEQQALAHARAVVAADAAAVQQAEAQQQRVQTRIRWQTQTIIKEIPGAVTPQVDRDFPLPWGFVRVHDAAARGLDLSAVAEPPGVADASASSVRPSDALAAITANYGDCRADAAELAEWQAWYATVLKAHGQ